MSNSIYDEKKTNILIQVPKNNVESNSFMSEKDTELKDRLMKLIIDTREDAIELKVNGDHYRRVGIHDEWRQVDFNSKKATYFSYQEKAAKDFIYRFNKCGILSDQVGMGKTIEAGMIVSELAYRKELGSLLILVPNENMAEKWETELARKFGFRNFYKDLDVVEGKEEKKVLYNNIPKIKSVKSLDDIYSLIYIANNQIETKNKDTFFEQINKEARTCFKKICSASYLKSVRLRVSDLLQNELQINSKEFKMEFLKLIYLPVIDEMVKQISENLGFEKDFKQSNYDSSLSSTYYHIVDMYLDTPIDNPIIVNGIMERLFDSDVICNSIVEEFGFITSKKGEEVLKEINELSLHAESDKQRLEYVNKIKNIANEIKKRYSILIVSKIVNYEGDEKFNLLSYYLDNNFESESSKHCSNSLQVEKGYQVIDLLIDMSYKTLIVDEAHDYIKVSHKCPMREDIASNTNYEQRQKENIEFSDIDLSSGNFSSLKYYVFPLYNDYYFVEKNCLFLKVKALAERSFRKIFMTATPIKSDMIDFYLLYLLADNSENFETIRSILSKDEKALSMLSTLLINAMSENHKKAMNYCTYEDIVLKYLHLYNKKNQASITGSHEEKIKSIIENTIKEKSVDIETLNEICINKVRMQFQQTFTIHNQETDKDEEITSISKLVSSDEGIEQWQNMYSQIGIRSTRHQTFKLDETHLEEINSVQRDKYRNLPVWSRRNGTIIYIHKKDNYLDLIIKEQLDKKKKERLKLFDKEDEQIIEDFITKPKAKEVSVIEEELNNTIESIKSEDHTEAVFESKTKEAKEKYFKKLDVIEQKYVPKETAIKIYQYINQQLTGKLEVADYYSTDVDYDEFKLHMVAKLMTNGLELENDTIKKIDGKVLLFTDEVAQKKVLNWLKNEIDDSNKNITDDELTDYTSRYKHEPLWYYNSHKENIEDKWVVTTDIKALKEKKGNYIIVVEPNKYEEGVDLQTSNTLINFDIKFCPLKMEQRIGRIDRVKMADEQPQLEIISFTPLNDMSGFMVDFLANDLKMFSCWKGDTTGIVSMPLGDKPNSATFESAILDINEAYKYLYNFEASKFIASCKNIVEMGKNFTKDCFQEISKMVNDDTIVLEDFRYLKDNIDSINKINLNSYCSDSENGDEGWVIFDELCTESNKKAIKEGKLTSEALTEHKNNLQKLKEGIEEYYTKNIARIKQQLETMTNIDDTNNSSEIGRTNNSSRDIFKQLNNSKKAFEIDYIDYKNSELYNLPSSSLGIEKVSLDKTLLPIQSRYKAIVNHYLDILIDIFDSFCFDVADRSKKMTRFISYLTIEEFRVMAGNYE